MESDRYASPQIHPRCDGRLRCKSRDTHAVAQFVKVPESQLSTVRSKDGTLIAVECAGTGPSLVIVHGGTGDRSRWTPLFPPLCIAFHGLCDGSPQTRSERRFPPLLFAERSRRCGGRGQLSSRRPSCLATHTEGCVHLKLYSSRQGLQASPL